MADTSALLSLMQWLSPAFPTGAYAYSHGLEWAIAAGDVTDAATAESWLRDILQHGTGWQDAILLVQALAQNADHAALAAYARALAPSRERLIETNDQGAAFARGVSALGFSVDAGPLPVVVGQAATTLGLPKAQVAALFLHAFAANLVSVAVRFIPLGQSDGQRILAALHPVMIDLARRAETATLANITAATIGADLASMCHETMDVRLYRT